MINGFLYLFSKDLKYDRIGHASAEIGTIFTSLVLITGPIWATPIWGKPWVWEPRLVTTLVLFLIYIGYFILRNIGLYRQRAALVSAIIGIIAFLDIPIIFASVNFWAAEIQSHPQLGMNKQPSGILNPFLFSLVSFTSLMILMLMLKIEVLKKKDIEDRYV
jgi:heme exporter protein C